MPIVSRKCRARVECAIENIPSCILEDVVAIDEVPAGS